MGVMCVCGGLCVGVMCVSVCVCMSVCMKVHVLTICKGGVYDSCAHILNNSYQPPSASAPTPCCRPSSQMAQDLFVLCLKN